MITLDLKTPHGVFLKHYPDGQPTLSLGGIYGPNAEVQVVCSLTSADKLLQLLEMVNVLDYQGYKKERLTIHYLMAARSDQRTYNGSFDLQVVAKLINSCNFKKVSIYEPHSDVSIALIDNAFAQPSVIDLFPEYKQEEVVLICPDAGAAKRIPTYLKYGKNIHEIVYCIKNRNPNTGQLTIRVLEPEKCLNRNCLIIDDICDGGATFNGIAQQIKPKHLTLMVAHGIFSTGFIELEKNFDEIIVSDSYASHYHSPIVKLVKIPIENEYKSQGE